MQLKNLALSYNISCWQGAFNNKNRLHSTVTRAIQTDLLHSCRNLNRDTYWVSSHRCHPSTYTLHWVRYKCMSYFSIVKSWTHNIEQLYLCLISAFPRVGAVSVSRLLPIQLFLYVTGQLPLGKLLHCFLGRKIESDQGPHSSTAREEFHDLIWGSDRQISQWSYFSYFFLTIIKLL